MNFFCIVITPEEEYTNEIEMVYKLFKSGLKLLHVRKPGFTEVTLKNYLKAIPKQFHKKIVIHSHYGLIKEFNLKGIHLTEKARTSVKSIRTVNKEKIVSASFHSYKDILKSRREYEYIFLSPVFDSISKQNYKSAFEEKELPGFIKKSKNKIMALGGVTDSNIRQVKQMGFSGAAVLGYIWESSNPVKSYKELVLKIK